MGLSLQRKLLFSAAVTAGVLGLGELAARQVDLVLPSWGAADNPSVVMTGHPSRLWGLTGRASERRRDRHDQRAGPPRNAPDGR